MEYEYEYEYEYDYDLFCDTFSDPFSFNHPITTTTCSVTFSSDPRFDSYSDSDSDPDFSSSHQVLNNHSEYPLSNINLNNNTRVLNVDNDDDVDGTSKLNEFRVLNDDLNGSSSLSNFRVLNGENCNDVNLNELYGVNDEVESAFGGLDRRAKIGEFLGGEGFDRHAKLGEFSGGNLSWEESGFDGRAEVGEFFGENSGGERNGFNRCVELGRNLGGEGYGSFCRDAELGEFSGGDGGGLRVVGIEDDSESDLGEEGEYGIDRPGRAGHELCEDCVCLEDEEDLEWEEVDEMERERLSIVINGLGEFSLSSEFSSHEDEEIGYDDDLEDAVRNYEWDILLGAGDLERNPNFDGTNGDGNSYLDVGDADYIYAAEYQTLFGQFMVNGSGVRGGPPAAKRVLVELLEVVLEKEEAEKNDVACAICKEGILVEEKVRKLPCCHYFHGDCILPWLNIRNTCPVCRYELPTDDLDYERQKNQSAGFG